MLFRSTPLHVAAWRGHTGVVELLLRNGALAEARDINGNTASQIAAQNGHTGIVQLLRKKAAEHVVHGSNTR